MTIVLEKKIRNYSQFYYDDTDYLFGVLKHHSISEVVQAIHTILMVNDPDQICGGLLFLRDLFLRSTPGIKKDISKEIDRLKMLDTFEELIYSSNSKVRSEIIYTLGKTDFEGSLELLKNAISTYASKYPEHLEKLNSEIDYREK